MASGETALALAGGLHACAAHHVQSSTCIGATTWGHGRARGAQAPPPSLPAAALPAAAGTLSLRLPLPPLPVGSAADAPDEDLVDADAQPVLVAPREQQRAQLRQVLVLGLLGGSCTMAIGLVPSV